MVVAPFVHDFETGSMEQKDLLGGKGANLAEMTRLGLPVPPGFTITTEACRALPRHGCGPRRTLGRGRGAPRRAGGPDGPDPRRPRRPAARVGALGWEVLHARDDGDRPRRRARRASVEGLAARRPATPASPGTPTAGCSRCSGEPSSTSTATPSRSPSRRRRRREGVTADVDLDADDPPRPRRHLRGDRRGATPAPRSPRTRTSSCAAAVARGLPVVELGPGDPLPPPRADPPRPRHGGQRPGHGLRQPRRGLGLGRRLHPRPGHRCPGRRTATTSPTPRARTSSPASGTP